jgi:DNA-binding CsgD family transcriptional regulator
MTTRSLLGPSVPFTNPAAREVLTLLGRVPLPSCVFAPEVGLQFANPAWLSFRGKALAQERGDRWQQAIHPDDRVGFLEAFREALRRTRPFIRSCRFQRYDGLFFPLQFTAAAHYLAEGLLGYMGGFILSATDSARRRGEPGLTSREGQVLQAVAGGLDGATAAQRLRISQRSLKAHLSTLFRKLHADNRTQLALCAVTLGVIPSR